MFLTKNQKRLLHASLISLAVMLFSGWIFQSGGFRVIENWSDDFKASLFRDELKASEDVVVLMIDEASLSAMDPVVGRWPWPRSVWADVIEYMAMAEAQAVVFDILFTETHLEADGSISHHDLALVDMSAQTDFVTHAMQILEDPHNPYADRPLPEGFAQKYRVEDIQGLAPSNNNTFYIPFNPLRDHSHRMAVVEFAPDPDGVYRSTRLFRDYQGDFYPVLSMSALLDRLAIKQITFEPRQVKLDDLVVPLNRQGNYAVNFYGEFESYAVSSVLASVAALRQGDLEALYTDPRLLAPETFANKLVLIGTSAVGLEDLKNTPVDSRWPGVFLHAAIASNILMQDFIYQVPESLVWLTIFFISLIVLLMALRFSSLAGQLLLPSFLLAGLVALSLWLFAQYHIQFDLIPGLFSGVMTWLMLTAYFAATEGREKQRVRAMLSQYVSPAALTEVLDNYEDQLNAQVGKEEEMSIVFSDVRGFTSISEKLSAQEVVKLLNIHLEEVTKITFDNKGTVDKFIGDASMAFWGAPLKDDEHAYNATVTALQMTRAMPKVNAILVAEGLQKIDVGVGVNTGRVVLGNIGSSQKLDYTIIGDAVNLGSRVEGLTKEYHLPVLISEFTWAQVKERIVCMPVDRVRVKGKNEPVLLLCPLAIGDKDEADDIEQAKAIADQVWSAYNTYHLKDFALAKQMYSSLPEKYNDFKQLFIDRCDAYITTPPAEDWDGVFTLTHK
jgi:adenylate cyclase